MADALSVGNGGTLIQTGGTTQAGYVSVNQPGIIRLGGGTLQINRGIDLNGSLNASGGAALIDASTEGILDFGHGTFTNTSQLSIIGSAHTLVIFPAGFNPATQLAAYSNPGATGYAGSSIPIPAGVDVVGQAR